jgi:TolB-like protein
MQLVFGDHALDIDRRELSRRGEPVVLAPQVFDLLVYLVRNRDRVVTKDDLVEAVWGGRIVSESALTTRINAVRKAIGDSGAEQRLVRTVARKGIRFVGEVREEHEPPGVADATLQPATEPAPLVLPDKPSIAVLPFQNISGDPEQEYFADGMVEEIITALSHIRSLFVIARNSTFTYKSRAVDVKQVGRELGVRYVLEGSVRKAGTRVRITGQLIDAASGAHLWADHFDGALDDIFALQDEVAGSVAGIIEPALQAAEVRRAARRPTDDLTAYDLYLRALPLFFSFAKVEILKALDLLEQAVARDPDYGPALALSAACRLHIDINAWTEDLRANRQRAIEAARHAFRVGEGDPVILVNIAFVLAYFGEDIDAMLTLVERAMRLNPSYARGWYLSGLIRLWAGQPERAIEDIETSLRLNPRDRFGVHAFMIGTAHFLTRRFDQAVPMLLLAIQQHPAFPSSYRFLASCYVHLGRIEAAREIIGRLRLITPALMPTSVEQYRNPDHRELYLSGLRLVLGEEV